ncbi:hypothetical protein DWC19_04320 [Streptomyces sp. M7]|nr:hypothetical protein DWC19_04320 [Streptomyces sp. M7]
MRRAAVTRTRQRLDWGDLSWVYDHPDGTRTHRPPEMQSQSAPGSGQHRRLTEQAIVSRRVALSHAGELPLHDVGG